MHSLDASFALQQTTNFPQESIKNNWHLHYYMMTVIWHIERDYQVVYRDAEGEVYIGKVDS